MALGVCWAFWGCPSWPEARGRHTDSTYLFALIGAYVIIAPSRRPELATCAKFPPDAAGQLLERAQPASQPASHTRGSANSFQLASACGRQRGSLIKLMRVVAAHHFCGPNQVGGPHVFATLLSAGYHLMGPSMCSPERGRACTYTRTHERAHG